MNDHSIFVCRSAYIDTSIISFSVAVVRPSGRGAGGDLVHLTSGVGLPSRSHCSFVSFPKKPVTCPGEDLENLGDPE